MLFSAILERSYCLKASGKVLVHLVLIETIVLESHSSILIQLFLVPPRKL